MHGEGTIQTLCLLHGHLTIQPRPAIKAAAASWLSCSWCQTARGYCTTSLHNSCHVPTDGAKLPVQQRC